MYDDKWTGEQENNEKTVNEPSADQEGWKTSQDAVGGGSSQADPEPRYDQSSSLDMQSSGQTASQSYGQNMQGSGQTASQSFGQNMQGGSQTAGQGYSQYPYGQSRPGYDQSPYGQPEHTQQQRSYTDPCQYGNGNRTPFYQENPAPKAPKKKSLMRSAALVTAAAVVFGTVAGGTMFGVNRAAQILFPLQTQAAAESGSPLAQTPTAAAPQALPQNSSVVIEDVSSIVDAVMPCVVAITNTMLYRGSTWFGQTQTYEVPSSGSGIIVGENESELLVVTNNHVIEDATSLSVTFIDQSTVDAAIKGTDSDSDLAVIAIPLDKISADTKAQIKAATLGDSDSLKMGQGVIAIGNALGLGQSVTVGHVSALDRQITVDGVQKTVIQTDAAINPGNSGGALLNSRGEVIGINEAKYASEKVEGVGYAIPISNVKDIIDDLKTRTTKVEVAESEQGYLGIQIQNIDASMAKLYGMPEGVYVYKITENSAASESDLREKDIITKLDGESVKTNADLTNLLTYYKAGTTVTLTVQSLQDGAYVERQVEVTLKNRPTEGLEKTKKQ